MRVIFIYRIFDLGGFFFFERLKFERNKDESVFHQIRHNSKLGFFSWKITISIPIL